MEPIDWTPMAKRYRGKWVALTPDRATVIASGSTLKRALAAAQEQGYREPILTRMPDPLRSFIGFAPLA